MPISSDAIRTKRRAMYLGSQPPSSIRHSQYNAASGSEPRTDLCKAEIWSKNASPPLSKRRTLPPAITSVSRSLEMCRSSAKSPAISSSVRTRLASPSAALARASFASVSIVNGTEFTSLSASRPCLDDKARSINKTKSDSCNDFNTYTRRRLSSALFNSNEGFSVVAPTNKIVPSSMCGKKASC